MISSISLGSYEALFGADIKCELFDFVGFRVENILGKIFGKCIHFLDLGYVGHHNKKLNYDR